MTWPLSGPIISCIDIRFDQLWFTFSVCQNVCCGLCYKHSKANTGRLWLQRETWWKANRRDFFSVACIWLAGIKCLYVRVVTTVIGPLLDVIAAGRENLICSCKWANICFGDTRNYLEILRPWFRAHFTENFVFYSYVPTKIMHSTDILNLDLSYPKFTHSQLNRFRHSSKSHGFRCPIPYTPCS